MSIKILGFYFLTIAILCIFATLLHKRNTPVIQVQSITKPDIIGATASGLCALHCMATPFLFIATAHTATWGIEKPSWWQLIDYIFIVISFFAIYKATRNTTKNWMKYALWGTWVMLSLAVMNETFEISELPEASVYSPALVLVVLHLYNQRYCTCAGDSCCTENMEPNS